MIDRAKCKANTACMRGRDLAREALILRVREISSGHRLVSYMCPEAGLADAFLFGGGRSSLRGLVQTFASGRMSLYHDPVKDFYKVTDFAVSSTRQQIREDYRQLVGGTLIAEMLLKTSGGGTDFPATWSLASQSLDLLAEKSHSVLPVLAFIWHYINMLGLAPDPEHCIHCNRDFALPNNPGCALVQKKQGLYCPDCASQESGQLLRCGPQALTWLQQSIQTDLAESVSLLSPALAKTLEPLLFAMAEESIEDSLACLSLLAKK